MRKEMKQIREELKEREEKWKKEKKKMVDRIERHWKGNWIK